MTTETKETLFPKKRRFFIHHEGFHLLLGAFFLLLLLNWIIASFINLLSLSIVVATLSVGFLALALNFFRNPRRENPQADIPNVITSPCDGKLVVIEEVYEEEILQERCLKVSIFMSIFDVHINWVAVKGCVTHVSHQEGNYLMAYLPKSSTENERSAVVIQTPEGHRVLERQIAGAVARRISTYVMEGEEVTGNTSLGFIKFGSRIDLYLPLGTEINLPIGSKVTGNTTILGTLPSKETSVGM